MKFISPFSHHVVLFVFASLAVSLSTLISFSALATDDGKKAGPEDFSPFGIGSCHINGRSIKDYERWIPQMEELGFREFRSPQVSWGAVEPEQGKWNWERVDASFGYLEEKGMRSGALLIGTPKWNTMDKPGTLPVNNIEGWSNYVSKLVTHLKGRVHHYEVWNEPPNFTGKDQTPADYAKLVVASYDAAKAADPDCLVGLAAKSAHIAYLEQTIQAGAKDHFDYIVLHPYELLDGIASNSGSEAAYMNIVPVIRKMLAALNPEKLDVPIIFTELGVSANKGDDVQAHALVKAYVMGIAQGVECIQWFEGRDGDSGPLGLIDGKGKIRPAYTAMKSLIDYFGQHPKVHGWTLLEEGRYAFVFEGAEGPIMATWGAPGKPTVADFGEVVRVIDPMTNTITKQISVALSVAPVFVLDVPEKFVADAKSNQGKPLPWGGDFSEAKEISIEFGDEVIEKGLHMRSGASLADAVVAYGGSARSGGTPGGSVFVVDPGFLSYESTPIEIEVMVRRNPENVNSGFKLVYEGGKDFKSVGGWYTVPDNKEWHTKTWRIEDARFVNYWGYNFSLNSDGDKFNKYLIKSVKVRKVE